MGDQLDPAFTSADADIIRFKVKTLIGSYGYTTSDEADLQQELAMHVAKRMVQHDPARAKRSTFVDRIVSNKIASIIRERTALKRDVRRERALGPDHEPVRASRDGDVEDTQRRLDVAEAIASLPHDLQDVARQLMQDQKAEAGRAIRLTPQQMKTAIAKIARHFRELGFDPSA